MSLKISFGIIVLNGGFFLKHVLDAIYPFAHAICIAEGPVKWWYDHGVKYSTDETVDIIVTYPDPKKKISYTTAAETGWFYTEKDEQAKDMFSLVPDDTDVLWTIDADEIFHTEDFEKVIKFYEREQPTSIGFLSNTFYGGGFDTVMGGFESAHTFKRILKYIPGCYYERHRQPTLGFNGKDIEGKDITGQQLYGATGVKMSHYSYCSPRQVNDKINYYESAVIAPGKCIPNYMNQVFLPWCFQPGLREGIEQKFRGVHEFTPDIRGDAFTEPFTGTHPDVIQKDLERLKQNFQRELNSFKWTQPTLF